jgi:hypothetical protein
MVYLKANLLKKPEGSAYSKFTEARCREGRPDVALGVLKFFAQRKSRESMRIPGDGRASEF